MLVLGQAIERDVLKRLQQALGDWSFGFTFRVSVAQPSFVVANHGQRAEIKAALRLKRRAIMPTAQFAVGDEYELGMADDLNQAVPLR